MKFFYILNLPLYILMMHIPLPNLIIQQLLKRLSLLNLQLRGIIIIQLSHPEPHPLLLIHLAELSLLM